MNKVHDHTLAMVMDKARQMLRDAKINTDALDVRIISEFAFGLSHIQVINSYNRCFPEVKVQYFYDLIKRRCQREPVSRIIGYREFWGRNFKLSPGALDPRPDSETIIDSLLNDRSIDWHKQLSLIEFGVGSGCLITTLLCERPTLYGVGVDYSFSALQACQENMKIHKVDNRAFIFCGNWGDAIIGNYDIIVSNPPYINSDTIDDLEPEVSVFDPRLALDGGEEGLGAYQYLLGQIPDIMHDNSVLILEIGEGQYEDVSSLMIKNGFIKNNIIAIKDLSGIIRCIKYKKLSG